MSYKVIDNFLNNQFYEKLSYDIKGEHMPWYYTKIDVDLKKSMNNGLFTYTYYGNHKPLSDKFDEHIRPITESLDVEALILVRANLVLRDVDTIETPYHTDNNCLYSTTGILFLKSSGLILVIYCFLNGSSSIIPGGLPVLVNLLFACPWDVKVALP